MARARKHSSSKSNRNPRSRRRNRVCRWVAVGALAGYGAGTLLPPALAQTEAPPAAHTRSGHGPRLPTLPQARFSIPAGTLEEALDLWQAETGIAVRYASPELRTLASEGVAGVMTPEQALRRILGTLPAKYKVAGGSGLLRVTIVLRNQKTVVEVHAAPVMESPKFTEPVLDTPQTIVEVPRLIMQQQAVSTLRDALRDVAGLSLAAGEGGSQGDNLTLRGFSARDDIYLDGIRDTGNYYRDPFDLERVSVLEGPAGAEFGRGSTGGVVEQDSKVPEAQRFLHADLEAGTNDGGRATVDYNQSLPGLGPDSALRVNLMGDMGHVPDRNIAENRRLGVAPSLTLGLGATTQLTLSYLREDENDQPDYGIPWLFDHPAPVPRQNYYGFADGNYLRTYADIGTATLTHEAGNGVVIHERARYAHYITHALITEPRLDSSVTPDTPLDEVRINRGQLGNDEIDTSAWDQLSATMSFRTGPLVHSLVVGAEGGRETSDPTRTTWTNVPETSLLDPNPFDLDTAVSAPRSITHVTAVSFATYVIDTVNLGRHWMVTGAGRWDRFHTDYSQFIAPASAFARLDEKPTWRAALTYKPMSNVALYVDSGTSFEPSAESLSLSAATADLPPETGQSYEAGAKWNLRSGLALHASVFETLMNNVREPDPNDPLADVLSGKQRVRGFQIDADGQLPLGWSLHGGYAFLDSRVVSSQFYPQSVGMPLANVPRQTFNAWLTHPLRFHLTVGAGSNFVGSRTASSTAPFNSTTGLLQQAPGYWVFSAMARYPISDRIDLQVNVDNLFNRFYYDELHHGHVIPGPGRVALIGFHFHF